MSVATLARTTAFGLDVWADRPLSYLHGGTTRATGRRLELWTRLGAAGREWPAGAELISDERDRRGEVVFQIARAEHGYRFAGPRYGEAIVAADGSGIWGGGRPGARGEADWQRLLIAQALPFAAVLRGLEVLHASAVAIDGGAVAFLGPSGAGKTSVAVALRQRGAAFLADDVLAVERDGGQLLGHSGPPVAGVERAEAARLRQRRELDGGSVLAEDGREAMVRIAPRSTAAPLVAVFLLAPDPNGPAAPRFEPLEPPQLLGSTFNLLLDGAARLRGLLDVCALAAGGRAERVRFGPATDATALAAAVAARVGVEE